MGSVLHLNVSVNALPLRQYMYKLLRNFLFLFAPERVHHFSMYLLRFACRVDIVKKMIAARFAARDNRFETALFGLSFLNRVGLGAGFDKNALYLEELKTLGFGFVEIGTVTPLPQDGNEKPRLFRLPADKALINRMGFNNNGVEVIARRLEGYRKRQDKTGRMIIGGNIGKNKQTANEDAWQDYTRCFRELFDHVDYFVVNVSSPNTPGLRALQEKDALRTILVSLQNINKTHPGKKPLLLKIAPDLTQQQIDDVIDLAKETALDGLVVCNTTIARENLKTGSDLLAGIGAGGLSGVPLRKRSTEMVRYISEKTNGTLPIIASGGIFSAADAREKMAAGASLVQVWTGFIYEGPAIVKNILSGQELL